MKLNLILENIKKNLSLFCVSLLFLLGATVTYLFAVLKMILISINDKFYIENTNFTDKQKEIMIIDFENNINPIYYISLFFIILFIITLILLVYKIFRSKI